jgi:superoxide dismutase, Fe-Mn family
MKFLKAPQEIKVEKLPEGLSQKAFDEHYGVLYKGYVNKYNEIQEKLEEVELGQANTTYSEIRELKREEIFAADAIRLHEGYFKSLGGDGRPAGTSRQWIEEDFGSFDNWTAEFKACGMSARGWVVLAYDMTDGRLHNYTADAHSDGVWTAIPLLILDVYEHAYYMDFAASGRKKYVDSFMDNINWSYVNELIDRFGLAKVREAA